MTLHETAAAILSAAAVWLTTRRSPWCFPVGLLSVSIYIWVYAGARLYSEVLLQCFWVVMLLAGWWRWLRHLDDTGHVRVAPLRRRDAGLHLLIGVTGGLALGFAMHRYTNAALPWLDAMLTSLSLVGQLWQNRRHVAAWWMWIAVDVVYVGMFASKHLFVTSVLYIGFVALAVKGLRDWTRAAAAAPAAD
ncbi:nicotinamide riboside transporter PnuC [Thermomonas sp.]|uniref:nicotinamide riboside transporter PnuC n=1 Tax=Thermomonas sp. TaxID=1971895 RepID=UPI00391B3570